jgi:hypothetical protein
MIVEKPIMVSLMLDPRFKNPCIVFSFVGREQGVAIVEEYDKKSLYFMLVKHHEHLHPLVKLINNFANHDILSRLQFGYFSTNYYKHK